MIIFEYVTLKNFLSFGQQPSTFKLNTGKTHAVMGVNKDIGEVGLSANGVGKSTFFNAVIYALYGHGTEKLKSDEYVNIVNGKGLYVELGFSVNGKDYRVIRTRKPNSLILEEKVGDIYQSLTLDAMKNTDEVIEGLVGSYDSFMIAYYLSPQRKSFMAMTGPEQRSLIENMLGLDKLVERAETLKAMREDATVDTRVLARELENIDSINQSVSERIEDLQRLSDNFEAKERERLEAVRKEINTLLDTDFDELRGLFDERDALSDEVSTLRSEISKTGNELSERRLSYQKEKGHLDFYTKIKKEYDDFETQRVSNVKRIEEFISSCEDLETIKSRITQVEDEIADSSAKAERLKSAKNSLTRVEGALNAIERSLKQTNDKVESLDAGVCYVCSSPMKDHEEEKKALLLQAKTEEAEANKLKKEIDDLEKIIAENTSDTDITGLRVELSKLKTTVEDINGARSTLESYAGKNPHADSLATYTNPPSAASLVSVEKEIESLVILLKDLEDSLKEKNGVLDEIAEIFREFGVSERDDVGKLEKRLEKLRGEEVREKNSFLELIEKESSKYVDKEDVQAKLDVCNKRLTHIGYLIKLLTDSKSFIRRSILDNYIPYLNKRINTYTQKLGVPHVCEVQNDLTVDIQYMGRSVSYFNLSRGERLRLDVATTGAFRDMMGLLGAGSNLMLVDELFDSGLDASGIASCLSFVRGLAETVFLITHRENLSAMVEDKITITKINGFSEVS